MIPDDFDINDFARRIRPGALHVSAFLDSIFPPDSPTSARRGGSKTIIEPQVREAVIQILDAMTGNPPDMQAAFSAAMTKPDPEFFRVMAEASQHVIDMPHTHGLFAKHVIAARRIAADLMGTEGPLPRWSDVRREVHERLGQSAYGLASAEWSRVKSAAGLTDLPR